MTTFKEAVAQDVKGVFVNLLEFADEHNINGVVMLAVVDKDLIEERRARNQGEYAEGVFNSQFVIFVASEDLAPAPVRGELFRLDGERFLVDSVAEEMGILQITIEANDS